MSQFEEFASVDKQKKIKLDHQDNRQHARISLRKKMGENLALACDGITVTLYRKTWWSRKKLGIANIKDIGIGGIGLITSVPLKLEQVIEIQLQDQLLSAEISRTGSINNKLHFFGARWLAADDNEIISMINKIQPALI